eukprot:g27376.t1
MHREELGEVLIVTDDVLKAPKNMTYLLCSGEVLDDEGYLFGHILCMSSEEAIIVFHCGPSELAINELSIVSDPYEGILQQLQVS